MIKVVLIDDEPLARAIVRKFLEEKPEFEIVGEANDGFEALKLIQTEQPDLLFLDIQMPKINGFEMLELMTESPSVIFTTAFDEYAIKAFEVNAIDYLLKPFSEERFHTAIEKWKNSKTTKKDIANIQYFNKEDQNRIVVKDGSEIKIIPVSTVQYIEAYDDYVKIFTEKGYTLKKQTMNYFENALSKEHFIRIHRSYILNINELTKIESFEKNSYLAILKSGARIPISRNAYSDLKSRLGV